MDIYHHLSFNKSDRVDPVLDQLGIKYKKSPLPNDFYLITFGIYESDPNWQQIQHLTSIGTPVHRIETVFTDEEILKAPFARLLVMYERGYPQPKSSWISNPINYESKCKSCGVFKQNAPFRIKDEPELKGRDFMTLYWGSAIFATPKVIEKMNQEKITGFSEMPVLIDKTGEPSKTISQIFINNVSKPGLVDKSSLRSIVCKECKTVKYESHLKGVMHMKKGSLNAGSDIQSSYEWFGSGAMAYREHFISNKLAKLIIENKWQGVRMKVIELV
jgi:hypothetical protein